MMAIAYGGMVAGALLFLTMIVSILRQSRQCETKPGYTVLTTKQLLETTDDPDILDYRHWKSDKAYQDLLRFRDMPLYKAWTNEEGVSNDAKIEFLHICLGELGHPIYHTLDTSTVMFTDAQYEFLADMFPDKVSMDS